MISDVCQGEELSHVITQVSEGQVGNVVFILGSHVDSQKSGVLQKKGRKGIRKKES